MAKYEVTTFDVCVSGYERLRSYSEFIVVASIDAESTAKDLLDQWLSEVDACERPYDFDYPAAREAIQTYYDTSVAPLFRAPNPFGIEPRQGEDDEGCNAFLYIRVEGSHFPVY